MKRNAARYIPLGLLLALACLAVVLVVKANRQAHLNAALVRAVNVQNDARVDVLLAEGADANTRDETGHPPPQWYWGILHTLHIRKKPMPPPYLGPTVLMLACYNGDVGTVQALLARGANVKATGLNQVASFLSTSPWRCNPIGDTVAGSGTMVTRTSREAQQRVKILNLLVSHGANVNSVCNRPDDTAESTLGIAAELNETDAALWLLQHGANPNTDTGQFFPPLQSAVCATNVPLLKSLLAHGANPNLRDNVDETPLFDLRSSEGQWAGAQATIAKMLVADGADVNAAPSDGDTILMQAVSEKLFLEVRFLLNAGANVHRKDEDGNTALSFASGNPRLIRILKQAGATT